MIIEILYIGLVWIFFDIRHFPPLGQCVTPNWGGEYFEDYPTFKHKADVGG